MKSKGTYFTTLIMAEIGMKSSKAYKDNKPTYSTKVQI